MKKIVIPFLFLLSSCAVTSTARNFSKGSDLLLYGEASQAIPYLEEAVRLSPNSSSNHVALANAYLMAGEMGKAWQKGREALLCKKPKESAFFTFLNVYENLDMHYKFSKGGFSEEEILTILGTPDHIVENSDGSRVLQYGLVKFTFQEKLLTSSDCSLDNQEDLFRY